MAYATLVTGLMTRGKNRDRREVDPANTTGKRIVIYRFSCAQGLVEDSALSVVVKYKMTVLMNRGHRNP